MDRTIAMWRTLLSHAKVCSLSRFCIITISLVFCIGGAFLAQAKSDHPQIEGVEQAPLALDYSWVQDLVQAYPELSWFAVENQEAASSSDIHHYSSQVFNRSIPEFDCAIMSIYCMRTFLEGKYEDYLELVSHQSMGTELQWQSFVTNQNHIQSVISKFELLSKSELQKLFEFAIVFNEVSKTKIVKQKLNELGVVVDSQTDLLPLLLAHATEIFPSYKRLDPNSQSYFNKMFLMDNFDQIIRLEGGPEMFSHLKESNIIKENPLLFEMGFFVYSSSLAGTLGHLNQKSSLLYTEDLHQCLSAVKNSCFLLKDQSELFAYNHYLNKRAKWLGLDAGSPLHRVLTRIGAMLMLYRPEEGKVLKESLLKLSAEDLALVVEEFNSIHKDINIKMPTCLPAVLVNLSNNICLGEIQKDRLEQTIRIGLPFLAKVLRFQKESCHLHNMNTHIPLNFDNIAKVAENEPEKLKGSKFEVESSGNVVIHE
ncbi:MAG: hypothetical protein P0S95_08215 [Rhabdochlamydiaceae bacterium]|nr:hypothetical protein [Candidatus Amphrikana amoebophyrae]